MSKSTNNRNGYCGSKNGNGGKAGNSNRSSNPRNGQRNGNKPPYRGRNFGSGNRDDRRVEEIADTAASMSRSNPVAFYTKYEQFAHDAANIPFALPLGAIYPIVFEGNGGSRSSVNHADPGVMRLAFAPTIGVSDNVDSPINRSSINYYARLRSKQKAFGDYDHQDVTMMIMALDSACMFHALGRRLYGIMRDMTPVNRYYPRAIIAAHNVQFNDSQQELQDFRAWLNEFKLRIEQYALPDDINLIKRHQWMCEGLYTDSQSEKAQTYVFVPTGFWQYDNTVPTGSQLKWVPFLDQSTPNVPTMTIKEFEAIGDSLMNAMTNEADFALIAGDMYAYYDSSQLFKLPYVDEDYAILPTYDRTVLSQIENAVIMGRWSPDYTPVISQNPSVNQGAILFHPVTMGSFPASVAANYMNMHIDHPTADDVIEASRLMVVYNTTANTAGTALNLEITACASEILQWVDLYNTNPNTGGIRAIRFYEHTVAWDVDTETEETTKFRNVILLNKFDWAPAQHYFHVTADNVIEYIGNTWDTDNFTPVDPKYVSVIHTAALYSLFDVVTR